MSVLIDVEAVFFFRPWSPKLSGFRTEPGFFIDIGKYHAMVPVTFFIGVTVTVDTFRCLLNAIGRFVHRTAGLLIVSFRPMFHSIYLRRFPFFTEIDENLNILTKFNI